MPKKSHRVAAKQAELGQRKRRSAKHPIGIGEQKLSLPVGEDALDEKPPYVMSTEPHKPSVQTTTIHQRNYRTDNARLYNAYIWPEVKRIGTITGLVLVILATLTVALR